MRKQAFHLTQSKKPNQTKPQYWKRGKNSQRPNTTYSSPYLLFFWASSGANQNYREVSKHLQNRKKSQSQTEAADVSRRKHSILSRILLSSICIQTSEDIRLTSVCCVNNILRQFKHILLSRLDGNSSLLCVYFDKGLSPQTFLQHPLWMYKPVIKHFFSS